MMPTRDEMLTHSAIQRIGQVLPQIAATLDRMQKVEEYKLLVSQKPGAATPNRLYQIALTRIAEQAKQTNQAQALANKALATSVNTSPNVLVAQCLNTLQEMVKNGQAVPAGFSCWPGSGLAGVIANTGR